MAWTKTIQTAGEAALAEPVSFFAQKLSHQEFQEPGIQFFDSAAQAEQVTTAIAQHLASPSAADRFAPYFGMIPILGTAASVMRRENQTDAALVQLQQRIQEAKKWVTSSIGSAARPPTFGAGSLPQLPTFGAESLGSSAMRAVMFSPRVSQISAVLASIRAATSRINSRRLVRRTRFLTVEDL
jgi:hypothetical protein